MKLTESCLTQPSPINAGSLSWSLAILRPFTSYITSITSLSLYSSWITTTNANIRNLNPISLCTSSFSLSPSTVANIVHVITATNPTIVTFSEFIPSPTCTNPEILYFGVE